MRRTLSDRHFRGSDKKSWKHTFRMIHKDRARDRLNTLVGKFHTEPKSENGVIRKASKVPAQRQENDERTERWFRTSSQKTLTFCHQTPCFFSVFCS